MREILFKAKRVDNGKWVFGSHVKFNEHYIYQVEDTFSSPYESLVKYEVDPETVCFASSRLDENKVKIFSDDEIEFTVFDYNDNDTQHTGIVQWIGDRFIVVKSEEDPSWGSDGPFDLDWVCDQDDTIKIIGNIHDKKGG